MSKLHVFGVFLTGVLLTGCASFDAGQKEIALIDGQEVNIGGEIVKVIGVDRCTTEAGVWYSCWKTSSAPGTVRLVSLSNGIFEFWRVEKSEGGDIFLYRPNGMMVASK